MMPATKYKQPWLHNAAFDMLFILLPVFFALGVTAVLPAEYKSTEKMTLAGWVILVLLIDVAHVYSTLFRTYWDSARFAQHRTLYIAIPVACYVAGVLLYSVDGLVFWRVLAYLAVFHFIRQQYGFMRLYTRKENKQHIAAKIDVVAIYAATLYPLIYWHCTPGRNFNWFVDGDFIVGDGSLIKTVALVMYVMVIAIYAGKEIAAMVRQRQVNIPKNLVITGTFLSWYFGIVHFNGDMVFTLLNVVAHGIPYMALIWLHQQRETGRPLTAIISVSMPKYTILFFVLTIAGFAYLEEGLWDGLIWREHKGIFGMFRSLPAIRSDEVLALLVPLLSLPQSTHYVLDGFIWRKGGH